MSPNTSSDPLCITLQVKQVDGDGAFYLDKMARLVGEYVYREGHKYRITLGILPDGHACTRIGFVAAHLASKNGDLDEHHSSFMISSREYITRREKVTIDLDLSPSTAMCYGQLQAVGNARLHVGRRGRQGNGAPTWGVPELYDNNKIPGLVAPVKLEIRTSSCQLVAVKILGIEQVQ